MKSRQGKAHERKESYISAYAILNLPGEIHPFADNLFCPEFHGTKKILSRVCDWGTRLNLYNWVHIRFVFVLLVFASIVCINEGIAYPTEMVRATYNQRYMGILDTIYGLAKLSCRWYTKVRHIFPVSQSAAVSRTSTRCYSP